MAALAGTGLALIGAANVLPLRRARPAAAEPAPDAGVFRPTAEQWKTLTLAEVGRQAFDQVELADGRIALDADRTTPVPSPFTGRVTEVYAQEGQAVAKGAPLFSVAANEIVQGHSDLAGAVAGLASAQAALKLAREAEARQGELYRTAGGALKDWRQAQSDLVAAEGAARSAQGALVAARGRLAVLGEPPSAIAALERAPADSAPGAEATVASPVAGVVVHRALGPGQTVTPGGDPLFTISDLSTVWLTAEVREADAGKVRLGAPVVVTTPAWPGRRFEAKVTYVSPALDPDTRRLTVRAAIANPDGALKPEMSARFSIVSANLGLSPAAPLASVIRDGDAARVWVAGADGALRIRPVVLGVDQGGLVQVTQGLSPGERVVAKGALFVDQAGGAAD